MIAVPMLLLLGLHLGVWIALPVLVTVALSMVPRWRAQRQAAMAGLVGAGIGYGLAILLAVGSVAVARAFPGPTHAEGEGTRIAAGALGAAGFIGAGIPTLTFLGYALGFAYRRRRLTQNDPNPTP